MHKKKIESIFFGTNDGYIVCKNRADKENEQEWNFGPLSSTNFVESSPKIA